MPIKGLTESRRLPRLGKIHLGIKKQSKKSGALYPAATEYFVVPPEVANVLGDKPAELPILFPIENDEMFASQYYRSYSMTRGLVCRGDGETCRRMVDAHTGDLANRDSTDVIWKDGLPCDGKECPYYGVQCKEVMCLQFILPTVEGLGVWQIDTSSINSIRNINSAIDLIRGVFGHIAMVPLLLTLEPIEVVNPDDGKKKTVRVLNLRTKGTIIALMEKAIRPIHELMMPSPVDTDAPEDMHETETEVINLPKPDDGKPPQLIMPQEQSPADEPLAEEQESAETFVNLDWLQEALTNLKAKNPRVWGDENLLSFIKTSYKKEAKTVLEAAGKLNKGEAKHFVTRIEEALAKPQLGLGFTEE